MRIKRKRKLGKQILTFAELEALACFGLTRLFAFHSAGVTGHEAVFAQDSLVIGIDFHQSAGDSETEGLGLTFVAAAVEVHVDVVFFNDVENRKGLLNDELKNRRGEIHFEGAVVDGDGAVMSSWRESVLLI